MPCALLSYEQGVARTRLGALRDGELGALRPLYPAQPLMARVVLLIDLAHVAMAGVSFAIASRLSRVSSAPISGSLRPRMNADAMSIPAEST